MFSVSQYRLSAQLQDFIHSLGLGITANGQALRLNKACQPSEPFSITQLDFLEFGTRNRE